MNINGKTFEFDATTLEGIKAVEEATHDRLEAAKKANDLVKKGKLYDAAVLSIQLAKDFFIKLVGIDIVGDCNSPVLAAMYLEDFQRQCDLQRQKVRKDYFK